MRPEPRAVVKRARRDIREQRLWKARDRLASAVGANPKDQAILEALGEVHYSMGDYPAAWRYWILTARRDAETELARRAFQERFGGSGLADQLSQIPAREPLEDYPSVARHDLLELRARARGADLDWPREPPAGATSADADVGSGRFEWLFGAAILLMFAGPWLVGAGFLLYLIVASAI